MDLGPTQWNVNFLRSHKPNSLLTKLAKIIHWIKNRGLFKESKSKLPQQINSDALYNHFIFKCEQVFAYSQDSFKINIHRKLLIDLFPLDQINTKLIITYAIKRIIYSSFSSLKKKIPNNNGL